ncbi:alkaline phosphatase family protein [Conexibacter sp. JD483]|uniref:alkaline phosphatase family protein n=1 Tax=unclassified Conexibacter TaxID=2627773 RepID=UPI00271A7B55|nr:MULTISPECIES: alkaline phosphatase family protein [unclassified Conexibacter]MDO8187478.1 alkaline phosphatase family protein [Conexibacter sp. CPCC 205706]MDO8198712.1 alkaline phosphatase family protein [Conexibacter sp. CPCC 205762]MDR9372414.1 alkaline phosphatase family protein [Conexibacter sp. JD483]
MSRWRQWLLATLSVLATGLVLIEGGGGSFADALDAVRASAPVARTVTSPLLAGGGSSDDAASADDGDALADSSTADEEPSDAGASDDTAGSDGAATTDDSTADSGDDAVGSGGDGPAAPADEPAKPTKVKHVFVISLAGHGYDAAFGAQSQAPYLSGRLRPQGVLLEQATALAADGLPDRLAQIGGQPPNAQTQAGCPTYAEIPPSATVSDSGEVTADGCVFPNTVTTIGDQLTSRGLSWRAYVEDLDRGPDRRTACRHPASNAADDTVSGRPGDSYATRLNPFVYYHSLLDLGDCDANDGPLERLGDDLRGAKTTANLSWIAPNLCNSGSESPCADGSAGGLAAADAFLATWVPRILASPAYKQDGVLIVSFAGRVAATASAPAAGTTTPATGSAPAPGATTPTGTSPPAGATTPTGTSPAAGVTTPAATTPAVPGATTPAAAPSGGDLRNGALVVSRFAQAGTTAGARYDAYSLLRSIEDLFALRPLARAAAASSFAPTALASAYTEPPGDG